MSLDPLRARCADLLRELSEEHYRAGAGLQEGLDTTAILDRYADLAEPSVYAEVSAALAAAPAGDERRRLGQLREHVASLYEAHRGRELNDRIDHEEAAARCTIDGVEMPYRATARELSNEPDRARRRRVEAARRAVAARHQPLFLQRYRLWGDVARELGFAHHGERCEQLGGLPGAHIAPTLRRFLADTDQLYREALRAAIAPHGLGLRFLRTSDLSYVFRLADHDPAFPADQLVPRMTAWIASLGLDVTAGGNVIFDLDERPAKSPRPFCSPIDVPERVYLVLRPVGGQADYHSFLHELGHALHFGHTDPALPWEARLLGDSSVTEGFAFLFDRLMLHPGWLSDVAGLPDPAPFVRTMATRELMMNRKYAAQVLFELELAAAPQPTALRERWVRAAHRATLAKPPEEGWIAAVDPEFYVLRYQQGWIFEAMLSERLAAEHGDDWYRRPAAGQAVRALWRQGQRLPVAELAAEAGLGSLDTAPLVRRFERLLG